MNAVSQWWIGGLRTRKAKVMSSILMGGSDLFHTTFQFRRIATASNNKNQQIPQANTVC